MAKATTKRVRLTCDQCELLRINGVVCHETGCPNTRIGTCLVCQEPITKAQGIYHVPSDDGFDYHEDCAKQQAEFEEEENAKFEAENALEESE